MEKGKVPYKWWAKKPESGLFDSKKAADTLWGTFLTWDIPKLANMTEYLREKNQALQGSVNRFRCPEWGGQTKAIAPTETKGRTHTAEHFADLPGHRCTVSGICMFTLKFKAPVISGSSTCNKYI